MRTLTRLSLAMVFAALTVTTADAGYVFLKNGYILQGKIIEKTDDKVILDYPGGQVTVFERFIKHVVLDPAEEAMNERRMKESREVIEDLPVLETDVALELPSIDELVRLDGEAGGAPVVPVEPIDPPVNTGDPIDTTPNVVVNQIPTPDPNVEPLPGALAPVTSAAVGIAMSPPAGWKVVDTDPELFEIKSSDAPEAARITVQKLGEVQLSLADAAAELKSALVNGYPGVQIVEEADVQLGLERARTFTAENPGDGSQFVQVLVGHEGAMYLVGLKWARGADRDHEVLERCLNSLAFVD